MGEAGKAQQRVEILRLRIDKHLTRKTRVEFRNGNGAGGTEHLVIFISEDFGGGKNTHRVRIVERDGARVDAGELFKHPDHGGVIVTEQVELEKIVLHTVIIKMRGDGVAVRVVRRVLHRTKVLNIHIVRHDNKPAGVLTGRSSHADAARRQAVDLRVAGSDAVFFEVLFNKAVGGLFRKRADRAGAEDLGLAEHFHRMRMCARLILTREVEIDIGHLAAAVAKEGLKRNVKAVLDVLRAAFRAVLIRHIRAAAVAAVGDELAVPALRAAVVRRERVDLGNARHIGDERRADRPS